jgi:serine/threonine protein kinase
MSLERLKEEFKLLCDEIYKTYIRGTSQYNSFVYTLNGDISEGSYFVDDKQVNYARGEQEKVKVLLEQSLQLFDVRNITEVQKLYTLGFFQERPDLLYDTIICIYDNQKKYGHKENFYYDIFDIYNLYIRRYGADNVNDEKFGDILKNYGAKKFFEYLRKKQETINSSVNSKLLGEGSYGKVYKPPIGYDDNTKVGKLFSRNFDWEKEYVIGEQLRDIDRETGFLVLPETISEINKDVLQLRYGYAGVSFIDHIRKLKGLSDPNTLIETTKDIIKLMSAFLKKYLDTFGKSDLIHLDIKPDNVMYLESDNRLRLIDFSLVIKGKDIFNPRVTKTRFSIGAAYPFWSPEYNMYSSNRKAQDMILVDNKNRLINAMSKIFTNSLIRIKVIVSIEKNLDAYIKGKIDYQDIRNIHSQDAWGIGITFLLYIELMLRKQEREFNINDIKDLYKTEIDTRWSVNNVRYLYDNNNTHIKSNNSTSNSYRSVPKIIESMINIIVNNLLCVNVNRNIKKCMNELNKLI